MHDYKFLRIALMNCAFLVNTQTHRQRLTSTLLAQLAELEIRSKTHKVTGIFVDS